MRPSTCWLSSIAWLLLVMPAAAQDHNGFDLSGSRVPAEEIVAGGPPRDGIPALDAPPHAAAVGAEWEDDEHVVGVTLGGESRAYPLAILVWHEIVNDTLGGTPLLVSYCPLCGTAMVFDRRVAGTPRRFGVSGLLYMSGLLLYDRESESLWSQIASQAITGPASGKQLKLVRSRVMSWGAWRAAHPDTTVVTQKTGHERVYGETPYGGYSSTPQLRFPAPLDRRYHPKTPTVGLRVAGGGARAYPGTEVVKAGGEVRESFAGNEIVVAYDAEDGSFRVEAPAKVEVIEGFWFAWAAFHPQTTVFVSETAGD